jgi:multiple sugar transport system substrate-binding protein
MHPDVEIEWDRRSLKDFGDYPVDKLAARYDIILIDHPHVGICAEQGVLVPLNEWIHPGFLEDQKRNSVGSSHHSYNWHHRQWALAVDAAAQVSAYREDLLQGANPPRTWEQVFALAEALPPERKIGFPLCPTDAMCSFLTLCAQFGGHGYFDEATGIDPAAGAEAAAVLLKLLPWLHASSLRSNPIQMLDDMAQNHEIAYVPLLFGYSNYARNGCAGHRIDFTNIPSLNGVPEGSLLGGVGMAVSSFSPQIETAVKFAEYVAAGETQRTVYYRGGGQPGHRSAWTDPDVNRDSHRFFERTLETLDPAHVRPRHRQFPDFQERGGVILHDFLMKSRQGAAVSPHEIVTSLNELYQSGRR